MGYGETFESFRVARRIGVRDRDQFEGLRNVLPLAEAMEVVMLSHAGMVSVELLTPHEGAAIVMSHSRSAQQMIADALKASRKSRNSLSAYTEVLTEKRVEGYEEKGSNGLVLGVPLARASQIDMNTDRKNLAGLLSDVLRSDMTLPSREPYVTVGLIRDGKELDDDRFNALANAVEREIWPEGSTDETDKLFLFNPEVYPVVVDFDSVSSVASAQSPR